MSISFIQRLPMKKSVLSQFWSEVSQIIFVLSIFLLYFCMDFERKLGLKWSKNICKWALRLFLYKFINKESLKVCAIKKKTFDEAQN